MIVRSLIEETIRRHHNDPEAAALAVCVTFCDMTDIVPGTSGWFVDDQRVQDAVMASDRGVCIHLDG